MEPDDDVLYGDLLYLFNPDTDTVLNVEGFCEDCAFPLEYDRIKKSILDWSGALFVIEPKSYFSSRQEFLSFVSDNVLALFDSSSAVDGVASELHEQALIRKSQMVQRVSFELEAAASNVEQHIGRPVQYGAVVQLRHVNSGRYLCSKASGADGATQFEVVDTADAVESSHWRFSSNTRQFGNVKYAVEVQLSSVLYHAMMAVKIGPTGPSSYVISNQTNALATFKPVFVGKDHSPHNNLCIGDVIYITQSSSSKMLTSRHADYLTFHHVDPQFNTQTRDFMTAPARACFVIESANVLEPINRRVHSNDCLRLRCVCTGEFIALASNVGPQSESVRVMPRPQLSYHLFFLQDMDAPFLDDSSKPAIACTLQASPSIHEDTAFRLPGISDAENIVDSCFQITHVASNIQLATVSKNRQTILAPNFAEIGSNVFFRCSIVDRRAALECRRLASYKSAFEYLVALIGLEVSMGSEFVSTATHHFEDLARWLNEAPPQLRLWRQEGLHDNGCVELLRTLLGSPIEICKMPLSAIVKQQRYRHVCSFISSCGTCIEAVVANCPQNCSRFLFWIESLIELMMCFGSVAKVILECFVCSKGATRIVKKEHMHAIIDLSAGPARSRFYQSLSQLLLKGGEDSVRCQNFLLSKFFPDSSQREAAGSIREVVPLFRAEGKKVVVLDLTPDRMPQSLDAVVSVAGLFGSLCGFLDLADSLCHNHCDRAIKALLAVDIIPYKIGLLVLNDAQFPYVLRMRVLKVMHRLYVLTPSTKNVDCSKYQTLIPWSAGDDISRYSASNMFPDFETWQKTVELQDFVLRTIESNDSLGFGSDKDAFTTAALTVAISFCRIGTFCMPLTTVLKSSGPYFRSRASAFLASKNAERGKSLGISPDAGGSFVQFFNQFLQLELLLQPLQMLLDTSTDNIKPATQKDAIGCKAEAMRCISVILGIRRHVQVLQTLKRFHEDIAASKVSKNVDMLQFTPSSVNVAPLALQLVDINMTTLPATLTSLFCHPENTNRLITIQIIVGLFLDKVHFFKNVSKVLLMSDPLIVASHAAFKDFMCLMEQEFHSVVQTGATHLVASDESVLKTRRDAPDYSSAAEYILKFSQQSDLVERPIDMCSSPETLGKIHLVATELGLPHMIMNGINDILSTCAPVLFHDSSQITPRLRKATPRPLDSAAQFTQQRQKLLDCLCRIIAKLCPSNSSAQKHFFTHIDCFVKLLQMYRNDADGAVIFSAISAILEGNRELCITSPDVLIPDLIILLLRKGKWHRVLALLTTCVSNVEYPALVDVQKPIMSGLVRNFSMLVQLPHSDSQMFSERSLDLKESSVQYTNECIRLLASLCKDSPQNQKIVRGWNPIAEVAPILQFNTKHLSIVTNYIALIASAYLVPSFDISSERKHFVAVIGVLNNFVRIFCSNNGINKISSGSEELTMQDDLRNMSEPVSTSPATANYCSLEVLEAVISFFSAMYTSHQPVTSFALSFQNLSGYMIGIFCDKSSSQSVRSNIKQLLDRFSASRMLPQAFNQIYISLPGQFETKSTAIDVFEKSDDSEAALWPYFLNQEYSVYVKDSDECVASLVKHFQEVMFLNPALDFQSRLIWSIQQVSLAEEARTVLIRVAQLLWNASKSSWQMTTMRVFFSIVCDLFVAFQHSDHPSEVCFAAVSFCTDLLSSSETGAVVQGELLDVMKSYGDVCIASIQCILDSAVYHCEEYARQLRTAKGGFSSSTARLNAAEIQDRFLSFCQKLLEFLKSFCEGHFIEGQLLVGQSLGSANIINLATQLLCALASSESHLAHSLQLSSLDFLVESIQGPCLHNCQVALNSRIIAAFNAYIRLEPYSFERPVMPSDISMARFEKFLVFFQALLEETRTDSSIKPLFRTAATLILSNVDFGHVLTFLENACSLMHDSKSDAKWTRLNGLCSSIFVMLTYLGASSSSCPTVLEPFLRGFDQKHPRGRSKMIIAKWEHFISEFWDGIVSIEISRDRSLIEVFFFSRATSWRHEETLRVASSLDFSNEHPQGRLISFLNSIDQMHYELRHISRIATQPFLSLLMSMYNFFFYGRFVSVISVNLLMITSYRYKPDSSGNFGQFSFIGTLSDPGDVADVFRGPCVYFNFICYVYLLFHLSIIDGLPIIRAKLRSAAQVGSEKTRWTMFRDCSLSLGLDLKGPFHFIQCILALFSHSRFCILAFSCVICLYMVSDHQNWFSTVAMVPLLLELLSTSDLVQLAVGSVSKRWRLLCQVSIGTVLFVYWCACVIYVFFYEDLEFSVSRVVNGQSPPLNQNEYFVAPRHLWKCFVFVLDNSLRTQDIGRAFGIVGTAKTDDILLKMPVARVFIRIAISFLFWFVFQLIFLRIFPGVISDTFKDNRIKDQKLKSLRCSRCFVCGLESHAFILTGSSFERHVCNEHAPHSYMLYFIYLAEKDPNEYTGLESYVVDCIMARNVDFLPIGTSLSIQQSKSGSQASSSSKGDEAERNCRARLDVIGRQQKSMEEDLEHRGAFRNVQEMRAVGIAEIRKEHQKRTNVLKAYPFVAQ